jgi:predicted nucleotidyltransferase
MYFEQLWKAFSQMEEVEAIALGGSRAGQNFDEKSDYDLYIYCTKVPEEEKRKAVLENC